MEPPGIDATSATWFDDGTYELASRGRRFDEFEASIAARVGLGVAIDQTLSIGVDRITDRITALAAGLRASLSEVPGVVVRDGGRQQCGIVTWTMADADAATVQAAARAAGVNVSVASAPHARLDMAAEGLTDVVRASPHAYNDESDLERLMAVVSMLA
jgi:selenocysteine lyase/cysteine desulfurase